MLKLAVSAVRGIRTNKIEEQDFRKVHGEMVQVRGH